MILVVNNRPQVRGTDKGIWRRIRLIPWETSLPESEQRSQADVLAELAEEASGILSWLLSGLRDHQEDPKWSCPEVREATDDYRASEDVIGDFVDEECELGPDFEVTVGAVYDAYKVWAERQGGKPIAKRTFGDRLRERGLDGFKSGNARRWRGIRMRGQESNDDPRF